VSDYLAKCEFRKEEQATIFVSRRDFLIVDGNGLTVRKDAKSVKPQLGDSHLKTNQDDTHKSPAKLPLARDDDGEYRILCGGGADGDSSRGS
jgi:hypothetical protein